MLATTMVGFREIVFFLFTSFLIIVASINIWKLNPERYKTKRKMISILSMLFCFIIIGIVFLNKKRLIFSLLRLDIIFLFVLLLPYMLRIRYVWRVLIAVMLVAINIIIVYHFSELYDYIGANLLICAPFLLIFDLHSKNL